MARATKAKRVRGISTAAAQVLALTAGKAGVVAALERGDVTAATVRKAAAEMREAGQEKPAGVLDAAADQVAPKSDRRGRSMPEVGEQRVYRAQATDDDGADAWIRVPVVLLGAGRGDGVLVTFRDGEISLTR